MVEYDIFLCRKCGSLNAGRTGAATFSCPHCGTRNTVAKSVRLAARVESRQVQGTMARMKMERGGRESHVG